MKKVLVVLLLMMVAGFSLSAWEAEDLTKFPAISPDGALMLNFGVGFALPPNSGSDYWFIPPIRVSLDFNKPMGDSGLPFFFGGLVNFSGHGYTKDPEWSWFNAGLGARIGYHFNWDVDKLDTYAVTTIGWRLYFGDNDYIPKLADHLFDYLFWGINLGARWFVTPTFGFWVETGFGGALAADIGLAFKF